MLGVRGAATPKAVSDLKEMTSHGGGREVDDYKIVGYALPKR